MALYLFFQWFKINPEKYNTERYYDSLNVKKNETLADYAADIVSRTGSTKKEADYTKDLKAQYNAKKLDDAYEFCASRVRDAGAMDYLEGIEYDHPGCTRYVGRRR